MTFDVEMEVAVRKYPVDTARLIKCLADHKKYSNEEIADRLGQPKTLVDHWFRKDKWFAVPNADVWLELKRLLDINTDEFDESIMTYEYKGGSFDMRNRIYWTDIAPTLNTVNSETNLYLLERNGGTM